MYVISNLSGFDVDCLENDCLQLITIAQWIFLRRIGHFEES